MKFNTFFEFIKLSFSKIILTSFNVANIRLQRILHSTLKQSYSSCITDCQHDFEKGKHLENIFKQILKLPPSVYDCDAIIDSWF